MWDYIDRIDSFEPGTIRVVDYKTGRVEEEEMEINDDKGG
ncbi:MAG: PD-(D/E)XK nuclease family protein [Candidatus Cryptobacteroides sp.]